MLFPYHLTVRHSPLLRPWLTEACGRRWATLARLISGESPASSNFSFACFVLFSLSLLSFPGLDQGHRGTFLVLLGPGPPGARSSRLRLSPFSPLLTCPSLSILSPVVFLVGVVGMMKGGSKRLVVVEGKSFDLVVEGRGGDVLRITDNAGHRSHDPSTTLVASNLASPSLPQLLPACCPQCGFIGEPTVFLLSCAATVSSPAYPALPSSSPVTFSSLEDS
ncbi:hypothetical protein Cgig2_023366 [Carnegiea gigantea]|uniref:Uncharacterized protein n=1 Tax=Carnegiea gigantea TaxID=171969 RepID=A0A9Q1GP87_9CARY|nr:hypothetical protein Cgig2_023366 [Carnegiea gigantea]